MSLNCNHYVILGGRRQVLRDEVHRSRDVSPRDRKLIDDFISKHQVRYEAGGIEQMIVKSLEMSGKPVSVVKDRNGQSFVKVGSAKEKPALSLVDLANRYRREASLTEIRLP